MAPKPERPDYDQTLKRLLQRDHDGFLALVAPGVTWRGELSSELPAVARRADLVWEVERRDGARGALHIELQTKPDADIGERVADYGVRLWLRDHQPVRSLVIFLRPAATIPDSPFVVDWDDGASMIYRFDSIRLWELPQSRILETPYYDLWPLASLMADTSLDSTINIAERIAAAPLPAHEREDLTKSLVVLAGLRLPHAAVAEVIRRAQMSLNIWEESSLKEALADLLREEIRNEGRVEGMREIALAALKGRFGPLDQDILDALSNAESATLTAIVSHIATDTLEQVRERLGITR